MQIRHYTISAAPGTDTYRISVKRETDRTPHGKVSTYLHDLVNVGDTIEVSAPSGTFILEENNQQVTLISGVLVLHQWLVCYKPLLLSEQINKSTIIHSARNESVHAFHNHVNDLIAALPNAKYMYGYSGLNSLNHDDFKGYLTKETLEQAVTENTICYTVGTAPFMKHVTNLLSEKG